MELSFRPCAPVPAAQELARLALNQESVRGGWIPGQVVWPGKGRSGSPLADSHPPNSRTEENRPRPKDGSFQSDCPSEKWMQVPLARRNGLTSDMDRDPSHKAGGCPGRGVSRGRDRASEGQEPWGCPDANNKNHNDHPLSIS